jgi:hypothetical protein
MNAKLQSVGCHSSTSHRTAPLRGSTTFTVREYHIYRAIVGSPMSVPEAEVLKRTAKEFGITPAEAKRTVDMVQSVLFKNAWLGRPEAESRHASDWKGEAP